jgi:MFS family permease
MGFRSLKPHLRPIYAPWVCASLTVSILAVALPLSILEHGRSYGSISVVMGAGGVGAALGALRVGVLTDRWGAARVAVGALGVIAAASCLLGTTNIVVLLALAQLAIGRGVVGVMLSRQAVLTSVVATDVRGRVMALMGGSMRLSVLVSAVSGGVLYDLVGDRWTFVAAGAVSVAGMVAVLPEARHTSDRIVGAGGGWANLFRVFRRHRRRLIRGGVFGMLVTTAREGRMVVLLLVGVALGLSPAAIGGLVAVGYTADLALFPVSGYVMDRFGRKAAMFPAYGLLAVGLGMLATADTATVAIIAGVLMGIGNGMSAGSIFTIGSDLAPEEGTASFLSGVSVLTGTGCVIGPVLVGVVAKAFGLGAAAATLAAVMVAGLLWLAFVLGETADHR